MKVQTAVADRAGVDKHVIKCVIWDLDNTLWEGTLLEGDEVRLREHILEIIKELDTRGILQSLASKNNHDETMEKLRRLGVAEYFLYPQINWNSKASSIKNIVASLNISFDAVAFIDDQIFEREEVHTSLPQVHCFDVSELDGLLDLPQLNPRFVTEDSKMRRMMYLTDIERNRAEEQFVGPTEEFLASLQMVVTLEAASKEKPHACRRVDRSHQPAQLDRARLLLRRTRLLPLLQSTSTHNRGTLR